MKNIIKNTNKKGFTIVELVIVIAVIAILAGVLIPTFSSIITKANQSAALQEAQAVYKEVYALDISDGKLDGIIDKQQVMKTPTGETTEVVDTTLLTGAGIKNGEKVTAYTFDNNGNFTGFGYTAKNGKTVTLSSDGTTWTVS